jgi:hypothetical protein
MRKYFFILSIIAITTANIQAQIKEGFILYDMKIEGLPPEQSAMIGDMETKVTFKNGKSLTETSSMMFNTSSLIDDNGMLLLMDQMGNKTAVKQTKEELEKEKTTDPKIEYFNDTKTIAGYECKKATITIVGKDKKEEKMDMWYCEKFDNPNKDGKGRGQNIMKGLKGVPFEYSGGQGAMKFKMVAKQVSTDPIDDSKFVLSTDGYKVITAQELKAMQGGK